MIKYPTIDLKFLFYPFNCFEKENENEKENKNENENENERFGGNKVNIKLHSKISANEIYLFLIKCFCYIHTVINVFRYFTHRHTEPE